MKLEAFNESVSLLYQQRGLYRLLSAALLVVVLLQGIALWAAVHHTEVVLVPPNLPEATSVSGNHTSDTYLSELAQFFVLLRFNVTPKNVDAAHQQLLRHVSPAVYGSLHKQLEREAAHIKRESVSHVFYPTSVRVSGKRHQVLIQGRLVTWVGSTALPDREEQFLVSLSHQQGIWQVRSFESVKKERGSEAT